MIAIWNGGHPCPSAGQKALELQGMLPGHIDILLPVKDIDRPARDPPLTSNQMSAAIFDEPPGDWVGLAIGRRPQPDTLLRDLPPDLVRELLPHQLLGHVPGRRD